MKHKITFTSEIIFSPPFTNASTFKVFVWLLFNSVSEDKKISVEYDKAMVDIDLKSGSQILLLPLAVRQMSMSAAVITQEISNLINMGYVTMGEQYGKTILQITQFDTYLKGVKRKSKATKLKEDSPATINRLHSQMHKKKKKTNKRDDEFIVDTRTIEAVMYDVKLHYTNVYKELSETNQYFATYAIAIHNTIHDDELEFVARMDRQLTAKNIVEFSHLITLDDMLNMLRRMHDYYTNNAKGRSNPAKSLSFTMRNWINRNNPPNRRVRFHKTGQEYIYVSGH